MNALVLVAHADDETLGCGGAIQRLVAQNWHVDVVIVADGIVTARGTEQDNRDDADTACTALGVPHPVFLGFPDQRFDTIALTDMVNAVPSALEPDLILTHTPTDLNRDHVIVSEVARVVARRRPVTILGCEIPSTGSWSGEPFPANVHVEMTSRQMTVKQAAYSAYQNEARPDTMAAVASLARHRGNGVGMELAEAHHLIRLSVPLPS